MLYGEDMETIHAFCQMYHRGQIQAWPCKRKTHPQFPFPFSLRVFRSILWQDVKYLSSDDHTSMKQINGWWEGMRQGGVLACLAPKGWGGKREGKMEGDGDLWLSGWDFSLGDYLFFFFFFFFCRWGTTVRKRMRELGSVWGCVKRSPCENAGNCCQIELFVLHLLAWMSVCPPFLLLPTCMNIIHNTHKMLTNINICAKAQTHCISVSHTYTHYSVCSPFSHCLYLTHNEFCARSLSISLSLSFSVPLAL